MERNERVDRRGTVLVLGVAGSRFEVATGAHDGVEVLRGGAATPADHAYAELGDEPRLVVGQLVGREVVVHLAVDHRRQAGVG